jgi:hypothetical protein
MAGMISVNAQSQCDPDPFAAQNRWFSTNSSNFYLINFSSGSAVLDTATNRSSGWGFEGSAAAVNPINNQLLFFTDGNRVVRASDWALSPTLVGANASATEAAAIIPLPGGVLGDDFVVFGNSTNVTPGNLITAQYKLSTNTISNVTIQLSGIGEALEVIPQANGSDYWILVNHSGNTRVYSYTAANGFSNTIISSISLGQTNSNRGTISWIPQQPNTVLIGNYNNIASTGVIGTATFDRVTGQLSNFTTHITGQVGYAPALSPNGRYIFYTTGSEGWQGTGRIWDLQTSQIVASTTQNNLGGAKLGPDGRIYWARYQGNTLVTFSNPNDPANGTFGTFSIAPATSGFNLPNNTYWACQSVCEFAPTPILNTSALNPACPDTVANLNTITATNLPPGFQLTWHTATPANGSNRIAEPAKVKTGTYYAAFLNTSGGCYGNAGATSTVTVTTRACELSGQVFHDGGTPDGLINTSGGNTTSVLNAATHVSLISGGNDILQTTALAADGTFRFRGVPQGSHTLVLHRTAAGSKVPSLASGWVNTAEGNTNIAAAGDGTPDGILSVAFNGTDNIAGLNYGVQQRPLAFNRSISLSNVLLQQIVPLGAVALNGSDFEDGTYGAAGMAANSRFVIKSLPAANIAKLLYNGTEATINQIINNYNPALLAVQYTNANFLGQTPTVQFSYTVLDNAGFEGSTPATYTITLATVLPVRLTHFEANPYQGGALLSWTTAFEQNNKGFYIERSANGSDFATLGFVPAAGNGNSTLPTHYTYTDAKPPVGVQFYRLRQIDKDGAVAYSNVVSVNWNTRALRLPNPLPASFAVGLGSPGRYQLRMTDAAGRVVHQQTLQLPANGSVMVTRPSLAPGWYQVQLLAADGVLHSVTKVLVK